MGIESQYPTPARVDSARLQFQEGIQPPYLGA